MCELAGLQHREIGTAISTDNASWRGPNTEASEKSAYNNVQVGGGPNTEASEKSAYNNVQVGGAPTQKLAKSQLTIMCKLGQDRNKFCENIISVLLPLTFLF